MERILLAYDGGEPAQRALAMAADLATTFRATLTVVSVVPVHPGRTPIDPWDDRAVHDAELLEAGAILRARGIEPELLEAAGDPAKTIERIATERDGGRRHRRSPRAGHARTGAPGQRLRARCHACSDNGDRRPLTRSGRDRWVVAPP